jgi:hypothetical protein
MGLEDQIYGSGYQLTSAAALHKAVNDRLGSKGEFAMAVKCTTCKKTLTTQKSANDGIVVKTKEKVVSRLEHATSGNYCKSCTMKQAITKLKQNKPGCTNAMAGVLKGSGAVCRTSGDHFDIWAKIINAQKGKFLSSCDCKGCHKKFITVAKQGATPKVHEKAVVICMKDNTKANCFACLEKELKGLVEKLF